VRRERHRAAIDALPGVEAVAFGSSIPGRLGMSIMRMPHPPAPDRRLDLQVVSADPTYRALLGMKLVHGRDLDNADPGAVLVNETLARTVWGRTDVAGEMLGAMGQMKIAGVVRDAAFVHPSDEIKPMLYRVATPLADQETILARGRLSPAALRQGLEEKIRRNELEIEIGDVQPLREVWGEMLAPDRARSLLTAASAAMVILLAALGFYSTQSYLVNAGRREYAIRAALGAGPRALGHLVMRRGFAMGLPGLVLAGLLGAFAVKWLRQDFISVTVTTVYVVVTTLSALALLVLLATLAPARHTRNTEPAPLLREE
jgi:hypothetical protein